MPYFNTAQNSQAENTYMNSFICTLHQTGTGRSNAGSPCVLSLHLCIALQDTSFLHLAISRAIEHFSTNTAARRVRRIMIENNSNTNSAMELQGTPNERSITHDLIGIPLAVFSSTEKQSRKADHYHIIIWTSN